MTSRCGPSVPTERRSQKRVLPTRRGEKKRTGTECPVLQISNESPLAMNQANGGLKPRQAASWADLRVTGTTSMCPDRADNFATKTEGGRTPGSGERPGGEAEIRQLLNGCGGGRRRPWGSRPGPGPG